jgi:hypothetical protein
MEIEFLPSGVEHWLEPRATPPRSAGHHVSAIVLGMLQAVAKTHRKWGKDDRPERAPLYEAGYAWEDALSAALSARILADPATKLLPPTELGVDDIFGTPDRMLWNFTTEGFVVEETKFTLMSCFGLTDEAKALLDNQRMQYWVIQNKTYAAMLRHYTVTPSGLLQLRKPSLLAPPPVSHIRAFFVNGDYKGQMATPLAWRMRYTAKELDDWWAVVLEFRSRLVSTPAPSAPVATPTDDPMSAAIAATLTTTPEPEALP